MTGVDWQGYYRDMSDADLRAEARIQSASPESRAALSAELRRRAAVVKMTEMNPRRQEVVVTDIDMPFFSMVGFMVKWAIASIPALIVLLIIGAFIGGFLAASGMSHR